jgi:hypothetical protein
MDDLNHIISNPLDVDGENLLDLCQDGYGDESLVVYNFVGLL